MALALRLFVALPAEARPLIDGLRLKSPPAVAPFKLFARDEIELWVSGIGKVAMAGAVAFAGARTPGANALWLNVGIVGHATKPVGASFLADRVHDAATGRTTFAALALAAPVALDRLITVDRPETAFAANAGYDMEASAFVELASRFAPAELVQVLKVVSDGPETGLTLTAAEVTRLVATLLPTISTLLDLTVDLRAAAGVQELEPPGWAEIVDRVHCTWSEEQDLRRLLRRRAGLALATWPEGLATLTRGREVNRCLAAWLDRQPLNFSSC